jgi:hypothetical protein
MNPITLLKFASLFQSLAAEKEKLPEDSNVLKVILKNIDKLQTFLARKKYADRNLKYLSSGSSRLVYLTGAETVVKLAKNERGLAQNKTESNSKMKSKYLNKILSKSKDNIWIEVEFLDKITEKEFEELTEINFKEFGECLLYKQDSGKKPKNLDKISKTKIFKEMVRLGKDFDLAIGDMIRISSWGKRNNCPILIDSGLTDKTYDKFYDSK